jgi:hypothetical protein
VTADIVRPPHGSASCACLFCWHDIATLTADLATERALADQLASHLEWALRCVGSLPMELRTTFDNRMAEVLAAHKEARREQ